MPLSHHQSYHTSNASPPTDDEDEVREPAPKVGNFASYGRTICRLVGDPFTSTLQTVEGGIKYEVALSMQPDTRDQSVEHTEKFPPEY